MDHEKKLAFIAKMTKMGLDHIQHFDSGGQATPMTTFTAPAPGAGSGSTPVTQGGLGGGLSAQTNYQATAPGITTQNFAPAINNAQEQEQNLYGQQEGTLGQLGEVASGQGPNPAETELAQATGTNIANTAALQAGQRGGAQNVGLLARQIGQQGAATQQNAVGQAATTQANQELGALGQEANLENNIAGQSLQDQQINQSAEAAQNSALTTGQLGAEQINAQVAQGNTQQANNNTSGLINGISSVLSAVPSLSKGGEVHVHGGVTHIHNYAEGGPISSYSEPTNPNINLNTPPPVNMYGKAFSNITNALSNKPKQAPDLSDTTSVTGDYNNGANWAGADAGFGDAGAADAVSGVGGSALADAGPLIALASKGGEMHSVSKIDHRKHFETYFSDGGKVPAMVSAGEIYLNPAQVKEVQHGANPLKMGTKFEGRAKVKGDSRKNDTIPVTLDDGGVVLPRHITKKMDPDKARLFVLNALAKKKVR